jgi:hypothetical protein
LVDGLGHGPDAADAAEAATCAFDAEPFAALSAFFERANNAMRGTRGGAAAAAQINAGRRSLKYAGIGNIAGSLQSLVADDDGSLHGRGLVSHNGIVGVQHHRAKELEYPCPSDGLLIMCSDGLQSRWSLGTYPGLAMRHPAVIAGVLYRDFTRGRDDVTVAVIRFSFN